VLPGPVGGASSADALLFSFRALSREPSDGALTLTVPGAPPEIIRGGVSDNGRYAVLIPGDTAPDETLRFFFLRR